MEDKHKQAGFISVEYAGEQRSPVLRSSAGGCERNLLSRAIRELSVQELLALVLRTGGSKSGTPLHQAYELWTNFPSLREIERAGVAELSGIGGICTQKATAVHAALELGRRLVETPLYRGQSFTSSREVFEAYAPRLGGCEQETFWVLLLDQQNRVVKQIQIVSGSVNRCPLSPQDVFAPALREKAVRLILLHNHPSGDPEPSQDDRSLTQRLQKIAQLLNIEILDHLIICDQRYVSFADRGLL